MVAIVNEALLAAIGNAADPLRGATTDFDSLIDTIGQARFVLLGEATHGTHEFYDARTRITQRLIAEGFHAVAVEADWPDAWRVNRYVRAASRDTSAGQALDGFRRFPHWMWRNQETVDCIAMLRAINARRAPGRRVGFYGLDLYSLFASMEEIMQYLTRVDPPAALDARAWLSCFDQHGSDSQAYGQAAGLGLTGSCEDAVAAVLAALQQREGRHADPQEADAYFHACQNARLVKNAEKYYRTMFRGRVSSWNLRDSHMADTLDDLATHLTERWGEPARIVVWAHNSHVGDARATAMHSIGEYNLGQLMRERHPGQCCLVGMTTYDGHVMAASQWDGPASVKTIRPAMHGSVEDILHQSGLHNFVLPLEAHSTVSMLLTPGRQTRAIGVIYRPETERASHYLETSLARQFDVIVHYDRSSPVTPLAGAADTSAELPETYPEGL